MTIVNNWDIGIMITIVNYDINTRFLLSQDSSNRFLNDIDHICLYNGVSVAFLQYFPSTPTV